MGKANSIQFSVFSLFIFLLAINSYGQPRDLEFDHYTTEDGLSDGFINTILQDNKGYMWIGTSNGLNRFDGITFKNYYFDPNDSTSLSGSKISSLVEDSLGVVWVMTNTNFCAYNRKGDCFERKQLQVGGRLIQNLYVYTSFIGSQGFLWISSSIGIFRFKVYNNPQISNKLIDAERFNIEDDDLKGSKNRVLSMVEDDHKIWIACNSKNLFYFDNQLKKFIPQPINFPGAEKFTDKVKLIAKKRNGDFLINILGSGLLKWDRKTNIFSLFKPNGGNTGPKGKILAAIAEDKNGLIWIGDKNSEGISIFNIETGQFTYCQAEEFNPYSLNSNKINCIYKDKTGSMWVGTIVGLDKYSPDKSKFNRYFSNAEDPDKLNENNVHCFAESKSGVIWIGTAGGGLNKFDRETGKFTHYLHDPANPNSVSNNSIISVCEDHEGTLWLGTYDGGLVRMKDGKFKTYSPNPSNPHSISDKNVWYVLEDSKKNLWVATLNNGLELFDRKNNQFFHYISIKGDSTSICNTTIYELYEDSNQQLYIATAKGLSIIDLNAYDFSKSPPDLKFRNYLYSAADSNSISSNTLNCIKEDNLGNLWIGTLSTGIDKMDRTTGKFTNFSKKDGLPGNSVNSILVDESNNLWLGTDKGLAKFNPQTKEVEIFNKKDGLINTNLKSWSIKTRDGEMFFGGPEGFNSFYPEKIKFNQNQNKPKVIITRLKIFNKPVQVDEQINQKIILPSVINETQELILTYQENFFAFEFAALDYITPEKNTYAYQMEGFDQNWILCGNKHEASYTNLNPGKYTFRVKASNNDGVWNEEGTSIVLIILPPWWETWWFRLIAVFAFIVILGIAYYIRIRHFKSQQILLEKLVAQKTTELQDVNTALLKQSEELHQINFKLEERQERIEEQSEELMAQKASLIIMNGELNDLNATKDKFFSIIAHDIKNPFNAILGFTNLLEENFKEWTDENKVEVIKLINESSKNLYQLLENLLEWSNAQRGVLKFTPEKIELKEALNDIFDLMNGSAEAKNIKLVSKLSSSDLAVNADRQMLNTIIRNLISNAIKFTDSEGKVQVNAEKNGEFVQISIIDNGVGIPADIIDQLFRIDSQHSTYGTKQEKGTGLGLILVKEFIARHGGEICVDSIVGEGSTFSFTLPVAKQ